MTPLASSGSDYCIIQNLFITLEVMNWKKLNSLMTAEEYQEPHQNGVEIQLTGCRVKIF